MRGFIIISFADTSPARDAGLKVGDVITKFGDTDASSVDVIANDVTIPETGLLITYVRNGQQSTLQMAGKRFGIVAEKCDLNSSSIKATAQQNTSATQKNSSALQIEAFHVETSYGTARALASISIFICWLLFMLGIILLVISVIDNSMRLMIAPSVGLIIGGWFGVQQSQLVLAITDAADSQRQTVNMLYAMLLDERNSK